MVYQHLYTCKRFEGGKVLLNAVFFLNIIVLKQSIGMHFGVNKDEIRWRHYTFEEFDVKYSPGFIKRRIANSLFQILEKDLQYFTEDLAKVKVYGKWHTIPRQQVAFGDEGIFYNFSGNSIPALIWHPQLAELRNLLKDIFGYDFNFVLVNRYRNGEDHIGEHRDDESELDPSMPIAAISLGQQRDIYFKHIETRAKKPSNRGIFPIKLLLEPGSLLFMNPPTNHYWYHSIPKRRNAPGVRISLTFRKINIMKRLNKK